MTRAAGVLGVVLTLGFVLYFARLNSAERITLDLGVATFYRVPMTWVIFGSLFLGMCLMVLASLHADLKVRRILRDRLREEDAREREAVDRAQRDLFLPDPDPGSAPSPPPPPNSRKTDPPNPDP